MPLQRRGQPAFSLACYRSIKRSNQPKRLCGYIPTTCTVSVNASGHGACGTTNVVVPTLSLVSTEVRPLIQQGRVVETRSTAHPRNPVLAPISSRLVLNLRPPNPTPSRFYCAGQRRETVVVYWDVQ